MTTINIPTTTSTKKTNGSSIPVLANGTVKGQTVSQEAFLTLLTKQLQTQDPFNPMDNSQMVAQMAQFSSVAGISDMNTTLKAIADQLSSQSKVLTDMRTALQSGAAASTPRTTGA